MAGIGIPPIAPLNRFIALWTCGCVFSEKTIKDMGIKHKLCPVCNASYTPRDIIMYHIYIYVDWGYPMRTPR